MTRLVGAGILLRPAAVEARPADDRERMIGAALNRIAAGGWSRVVIAGLGRSVFLIPKEAFKSGRPHAAILNDLVFTYHSGAPGRT